MNEDIYLKLLLVLFFVFANGFFVAAEFGLVKLRCSEIKMMTLSGGRIAKTLEYIFDHLDTYLSACQLGVTLASLALGWTGEPLVANILKPLFEVLGIPEKMVHLFAFPTAFAIITFLHITLGEQVPKIMAIRRHRSVVKAISIPLWIFCSVLTPLIWILNASSNAMLLLIGIKADADHGETPTEEELRHILYQSADLGYLKIRERYIMENVLDLEEKMARSYMVPRSQVVFIDRKQTMEEKLFHAAESGHTRFPLCEGDLDHIAGIVHVKDIFKLMTAEEPIQKLITLARKPVYFPETIHLDSLLVALQKNKTMMALLVDEFGSFSGLITMENILEELVGSIEDEFDDEQPSIIRRGPDVFEVEAECPKEKVAKTCRLQLPESGADTIGGVVTELMEIIPQEGDTLLLGNHQITILEAEPTRIVRLEIKKQEKDTDIDPIKDKPSP
ncbi:hemolysin family protein [bacterium]|nr:hemolysin family protein [bacterium]